jgi:hypothetical protein
MTVADLVDRLGLKVRTGKDKLGKTVTGGYASDLLSDVMGHAKEGTVWVTLQAHPNVVAVAVLKEIAAIVLIHGREPQEDTVARAEAEGVVILVADLPAFELVGRLYAMGVTGA